eukprot:COSAG05_NODE_1621_length_4386_cov_3.207371_3_plen_111_part_00
MQTATQLWNKTTGAYTTDPVLLENNCINNKAQRINGEPNAWYRMPARSLRMPHTPIVYSGVKSWAPVKLQLILTYPGTTGIPHTTANMLEDSELVVFLCLLVPERRTGTP